MTNDKQILDAAIKMISAYFAAEKPYLFLIDKMIRETSTGLISMDIRFYNGYVTDIVFHDNAKRFTFKKAPNKS